VFVSRTAELAALDDHQGGRWEAAFQQHVRRLAAGGEFGGRVWGPAGSS